MALEMERRPGIRPEGDERGEREPPGTWPEWLQMETFNRHWVRGRGRAILTPRPFIQVHHRVVLPRPLQGVTVGFGQVVPGPGPDHLRLCLADPQHYQPLPLHQFRRKDLRMPHQSQLTLGKALLRNFNNWAFQM